MPPKSSNGKTAPPVQTAPPGVTTVDKRDIPPVRLGVTDWERVYNDLLLMLEKTPAHQALQMTFETVSRANNCIGALNGKLKRDNRLDQVEIVRRKVDDTFCVYVSRGPNYEKKAATRKNGKAAEAEVSDFE